MDVGYGSLLLSRHVLTLDIQLLSVLSFSLLHFDSFIRYHLNLLSDPSGCRYLYCCSCDADPLIAAGVAIPDAATCPPTLLCVDADAAS